MGGYTQITMVTLMIRYMVSNYFLFAVLLLMTLSTACANKAIDMNIFNFFDKVRSEYTRGYKKSMNDIPTKFYIYMDDDSDIWYKAEPFSIEDNIIIETIDVRVAKGEDIPTLISMKLKGGCITIKRLRQIYSDLNLTNLPRSEAPGAKFYYTTSADDKEVTMSFGFTNESPDCLANVVIKIKNEKDYDIIPGK